MADYTIANLKDDLTGIVHSTDVSKIKNFYSLCHRAAMNLLARIDPAATIRTAQITNAVFDDIHDYSVANDLKGNKIIDIRPQAGREISDSFSQRFAREFDKYKKNGTFRIRWNKGTKTIRISAKGDSPIVLHQMDSITANGTWAVGGDGTNLTADEDNYLSGSASMNFDLTGAGTTGYIENSTLEDVDLTDEDEIGSVFVRVYIPDTSIITNFILRWGNDSSNYWHRTVTSPHDQSTFKTGWNILRFDWNGATEVGTVDPAAIDYLRVTVTYDGTVETDIRVDKIACAVGRIYEQEYYSENLFRSSAGTWKATPTSDNDIINLDEDGYNILIYECGLASAQQQKGKDAIFDKNYFKEELFGDGTPQKPGLYHRYKTDHPSEAMKPRAFYWRKSLYDK